MQVEILSGKELTNPPEASFGMLLKSYTWERLLHMIDEAYPIVEAKVYVNL